MHEKPEFNGGIPGIPEVHEKPEFDGGVVPLDPPVVEIPELVIDIPEEPTKPQKPSTPVERSNGKTAQSVAVSYNLAPVSKETPNTTVYGGVLPHTGEKEGITSTLGLLVIAAGITTLGLSFKKYNEGEEE